MSAQILSKGLLNGEFIFYFLVRKTVDCFICEHCFRDHPNQVDPKTYDIPINIDLCVKFEEYVLLTYYVNALGCTQSEIFCC
jgi:hypothetical protein